MFIRNTSSLSNSASQILPSNSAFFIDLPHGLKFFVDEMTVKKTRKYQASP
jgi:hypothetical protein